VAGFIGTTWLAGRIFRVGILMTGTKVNWKVLLRWAVMKD
jgi:ABC-2 type transport system permease protein